MPRTIREILLGERTCIAVLNKENEQTTKAAIIQEICIAVDFVHSFHVMTASQVATTAELILRKYYFLSIPEIHMAFENGMSGEYGEVKKMDGTVLLYWLEQFDNERTKTSSEIQKEYQLQNVYEANQLFYLKNEKTGQTLGEAFMGDYEAARKRDRVKFHSDNEPRELSTFEKMVMDEWDELPRVGQSRLKEYNLQAMDFTTYRETRFKEELEKTNIADD